MRPRSPETEIVYLRRALRISQEAIRYLHPDAQVRGWPTLLHARLPPYADTVLRLISDALAPKRPRRRRTR